MDFSLRKFNDFFVDIRRILKKIHYSIRVVFLKYLKLVNLLSQFWWLFLKEIIFDPKCVQLFCYTLIVSNYFTHNIFSCLKENLAKSIWFQHITLDVRNQHENSTIKESTQK